MENLWQQVGVPLVLGIGALVGGFISWAIRSKIDEAREDRARLISERRQTYLEVLEPFITLLSKKTMNNPAAQKRVIDDVQSAKYQRNRSELTFFGSDEVVRAYNDMMQFTFHMDPDSEDRGREMMGNWGRLLLAVRRDLGNPETKLDEWDMLSGLITDVDEFRRKR